MQWGLIEQISWRAFLSLQGWALWAANDRNFYLGIILSAIQNNNNKVIHKETEKKNTWTISQTWLQRTTHQEQGSRTAINWTGKT